MPRTWCGPGATAARAWSTASSTARARGSSASPCDVSATERRVRSNRRAPSSASSARTPAETLDCTAKTRAAARVKLSSSATATKYSSWRVSMPLTLRRLIADIDQTDRYKSLDTIKRAGARWTHDDDLGTSDPPRTRATGRRAAALPAAACAARAAARLARVRVPRGGARVRHGHGVLDGPDAALPAVPGARRPADRRRDRRLRRVRRRGRREPLPRRAPQRPVRAPPRPGPRPRGRARRGRAVPAAGRAGWPRRRAARLGRWDRGRHRDGDRAPRRAPRGSPARRPDGHERRRGSGEHRRPRARTAPRRAARPGRARAAHDAVRRLRRPARRGGPRRRARARDRAARRAAPSSPRVPPRSRASPSSASSRPSPRACSRP